MINMVFFLKNNHPLRNTFQHYVQNRYASQLPRQLLVEKSKHVMKLTLNRPKAANAMGTELMKQFSKVLTTLEACQEIRCVLLNSSSNKVFSAGADLKERTHMNAEEAESCVSHLRSTLQRFANLPMPTIAVVEGVAVGGGMELAVAADIIVSSKSATFGLPETSLGIIPGAGGTQRIPRLVGKARALDLILTGRKITGKEAYEYGIVQHLVEDRLVQGKVTELADSICQNAPIAVRAAKDAVKRGLLASSLNDALMIEGESYSKTIVTKDRLEGLAAFSEGRKPIYKGH